MTKTATLSATAALAGVLFLAGGAPASAQATWSLQPGADATQAQRPSGPVDAQNPVVTRPGNAPEDKPSPEVTLPAPPPPQVKAPAAVPVAPPSAAPNQNTPRPRASDTAARPTATVTPPTEAASPVPTAPQPVASPANAPFVPPAPAASASPPPAPQAEQAAPASHWPEWWLAIPVALLLAVGGIVALLRRRAAPATAWDEAGMEPEPEAEDVPAAAPPVAAAPPPTMAATPAPAPVAPRLSPLASPQPSPLVAPVMAPRPAPLAAERAEVTFEPVLMRQSLVYATLVYRMSLTAPAEGLPEGAVIAADMISAHASLSQAEQLAPDPASVPLRHRFDALAPGETREVKGEIQLPLNAIRPVRQGNAVLFVPLLRLFLALPDGAIERRVFSLGQPGEGAGLAPVRIDTGPRDHAPIQAREIDGARSYSGPHPSGDVPQAAE